MATKVFISWSGGLSNKLAEAVRQWLPGVLQFVKPYFTPSDIEKGTRWGSDIMTELSSSDIGIICLTKENLNKPWILFESGALSKNFQKSRVCTLLFDIETTDLKGPLTIFQNTRFKKEEFNKLVKTINSAGGEAKLEDSVLDGVFEMWWPKLEEKVNQILKEHKNVDEGGQRTERDLLEEILELTRYSARQGISETHYSSEVALEFVLTLVRSLSKRKYWQARAICFEFRRQFSELCMQMGFKELDNYYKEVLDSFPPIRPPTKEVVPDDDDP